MANNKDYGIVYLLSNPCMPGIVKIGMTRRSNMSERLNELYTTGVPLPFTCEYACKVPQEKVLETEQALHAAFAPQRVNENREFFYLKSEQVIPLLKLLNNIQDITKEVEQQIGLNLTEQDRQAVVKAKSIHRRPSMNYVEMGLKVGQLLFFVNDPNITCTISGERKVIFNDEETSLTRITTSLLGLSQAVQPTKYWNTEDGRNLMDIYDETYPVTEEDSK